MSENIDNLSQALVSSMEILAKSGDQALSFDKTIECDIIKIANPATGEYKVKYLNGTISAYDISLEMKYKAGDQVYVQVPQNDMTLKKLILGKKSTNASDLVDVILDTERVDKIGLPLEIIYNLTNFSLEHGIVGSTVSNRNYYISLYQNTDASSDANKLFQNYAENKNLLLIEAQVKTSWFENGITRGNYGVELTFTLKDSNEEYVILLDRQAMRGNSLLYNDWTPVSGLLNIEGSKLKSLKSIRFFAEDFQRISYSEAALLEKEDEGKYEIFLKDLSISFVQEAKTLGYTATINTPDGIYFTAISTEKLELRLQALFKYNGQILKGVRSYYYWFRRNSNIDTLSEKFDELAGVGWERLQGDTSELIITLDDFGRNSISQLYKVIVVYEDYICEDEVLLYRTTDSDDYELYLTKDTNNVGKLTLRRVNSNTAIDFDDDVVYKWSCVNNNGLVINYSTEISANKPYIAANGQSLNNIYLDGIIGFNTYYCNVFAANDTPIVTVIKTVQNIQVSKNFDVIFMVDGDGFYSYDVNGDYIAENTRKKIDFTINWKDDPAAYYYQWVPTKDVEYDDKNQPFLSYRNKMFEGVSQKLDGEVDPFLENSQTQQPFYFTIRNRYAAEKAENNIIQLNIIIDGITYTFRKNLTFLKEGAMGTNGTSLMVKVEPADFSDVALRPEKESSIVLKCTLYYNGQTRYGSRSVASYFTASGSVPYDYWGHVKGDNSVFLNPFIENENVVIDGKTQIVQAQQISITEYTGAVGDANSIYIQITALKNLTFNLHELNADGAHFNSIIQLKFTPNGTSDNFNYNLYKLYGVPLTNSTAMAKYYVSGAKEILYDTNGYNPKYSEVEYKIYSDKTVTTQPTYVSFGNYKDSIGFTLQNGVIVPWTYYSNEQRGAIYYSFNNVDFYCQPIIFTQNLFSEKLLNAWDGASLQIDDKNSTVLSAQIGAGLKDSDNKFTGVLMGQYVSRKNVNLGPSSQTGLLGFNKGESTFGLLDSGDVYFGSSGLGRIEFLTSTGSALIQSNGYVSSSATGVQQTYFYKDASGGIGYDGIATSNLWTNIPTSNMVFNFENNGTTNRGKNLDSNYYSVGMAKKGESPMKNENISFIRIKLKEVSTIVKVTTSFSREIDIKGESIYHRTVLTEKIINTSDLVNGGWETTRLGTNAPGHKTEIKTKITETEYNDGKPSEITTTTKVEYYLYVYDREAVYHYEYVKQLFKENGEKDGDPIQINNDNNEIYRNEVFKIETTTAVGQGMQINLTSGQIDAADFKLQSKTILINSQIKYYCNNKECTNYNKHLLLNGTCAQCGNDLVPYLGDYAIKIGADTNAFFIRHDGTGKIGGWNINQIDGVWTLSAGQTLLSSSGLISGANINGGSIYGTTIDGSEITGTKISATWLEAYHGTIGGWTINPTGFIGDDVYISKTGSMQMGSGDFTTKINSAGVSIGSTVIIDKDGFQAQNPTADIRFSVGGTGLLLTDKGTKSTKALLGYEQREHIKDGKKVIYAHPFLQLGSGGAGDTTAYWLYKELDYLWIGDKSNQCGIKITDGNKIIFNAPDGIEGVYATLK